MPATIDVIPSIINIFEFFNPECLKILISLLLKSFIRLFIPNRKTYTKYKQLGEIKNCARYGNSLGLEIHAGHGMDYKTTKILNKINEIKEFNIGHFIIGESIFFGFKNVIRKIIKILKK